MALFYSDQDYSQFIYRSIILDFGIITKLKFFTVINPITIEATIIKFLNFSINLSDSRLNLSQE